MKGGGTKMDWKTSIKKIVKTGNSRTVTIPPSMASDMGIDTGSYVKLEYDEKQKKIVLAKVGE